jgi:putative spermidine/putrescine transport system ATP-binding protein
MIEFKDVHKYYGDYHALRGITATIRAGEFFSLLGPSGCGKTTLLRTIAGFEGISSGVVMIDGKDMEGVPANVRPTNMVFQSYAIFPHLTVAENVGFGLRKDPRSKAEKAKAVVEALEMVGLKGYGDRAAHALSGGQRQRVALARALVVRPRVLLLDEPLTALDAKLRDSLRLDIDRLLRGLGVTAVYVTHDQGEAMALGDRIVVMAKGRVAQIGTPRDIYHHPTDGFVADFIGAMNRVSGQAQSGALRLGRGAFPWSGPDGPVELLIRPEDIALAAEGEKDTHLDGLVAAAVFLGDRTRLVVETGDGPPLTVDAASRSGLARGDRVGLRLDPSRLLNLPQP